MRYHGFKLLPELFTPKRRHVLVRAITPGGEVWKCFIILISASEEICGYCLSISAPLCWYLRC